MKKGGSRSVSSRSLSEEPRESWRKWILSLLALGFALLVITMLSQQSKALREENQMLKKISGYYCEQSGGLYEQQLCRCGEEYGEELEYDEVTGTCMSDMGVPGGNLGEKIREQQEQMMNE